MGQVVGFLLVTALCCGLFYLLYAVPLGFFGEEYTDSHQDPHPERDPHPEPDPRPGEPVEDDSERG